MAKPYVVGVAGDLQLPYADPWAMSVAAQILHDAKCDMLDLNGDVVDLRCISRYPLTHDEEDPRLIHSLSEEIEKSKTALREFVKHIGAKKARMRSGNHEWRVTRAFEKDDRALRLIGLKVIKQSLSPAAYLDLPSMGVEYVGDYPSGSWVHPHLAPHENVWIEHGYVTRVKAGYVAQTLMEKRGCPVVVGHCEKAALVWRRTLHRRMFAIESGNLSVIGEPERGAGLYGGVPHSCPEYMDHQQAFSILTHEGGEWWPELVAIHHGKAHFRGKLYKA